MDEKSEVYLLDITTEVCPLTFVKTKLCVERLERGQTLEVRLNAGEPETACHRPSDFRRLVGIRGAVYRVHPFQRRGARGCCHDEIGPPRRIRRFPSSAA